MSEPWRLLVDDGAGAADGLALDEALMGSYARGKPRRPPTLRLYSYRTHCALVGRYQNLEAEVDLAACAGAGTQVSRRPTGGGAIIMGAGQLGVALVDRAPADRRPKQLIEDYSRGIVAGLAVLGITAAFRGKNDLEVGGRKITGLGVYIDDGGAMLFHASVLADLDVEFMLRVLKVPAAKLADKAAAAVDERVTTVTRETGQPYDAARLRPFVADGFGQVFGASFEPDKPDPGELAHAEALARERYSAATWLTERSAIPDGSGSAVLKTPAGLMRVYLSTHGDLVKNAVIVGDFAELPQAVTELESGLRWRRLDERSVIGAVTSSGADRALGVAPDEIAIAVLQAGSRAGELAVAAPIRSAGSCYFPERA